MIILQKDNNYNNIDNITCKIIYQQCSQSYVVAVTLIMIMLNSEDENAY